MTTKDHGASADAERAGSVRRPALRFSRRTALRVPCRLSSRSAFTLVELTIVVAIIGIMATMLAPRMSFFYASPLSLLQRSVEEATNLSLTGVPLRFVFKADKDGRRGEIVPEALIKKPLASDDLRVFLGTAKPEDGVLEWTPVALKYPPGGSGWMMEPDIVYFYTDGSCTPASISWAERGISDSKADKFLLTVTGYCAAVPENK